MTSIYDTIKKFPVFQGASTEQISAFLEKTHIEFSKYKDGEVIVRQDEEVENIKFVVSGKVKMIYKSHDSSFEIAQLRDTGTMLGAENLFGMERRYPFTTVAYGPCGIMQFSKARLLDLLRSDSICLMNMLNYLSLVSQKFHTLLRHSAAGKFSYRIAQWLTVLTDKKALMVEIKGNKESFSILTNINEEEIGKEMEELEKSGFIKMESDRIVILSRQDFIEKFI